MQSIQDIYELSPLQQGMLFHTIYDSRPGVYCQQLTGKISGTLDLSAFQKAWQMVIDRHTNLRAGFHWEEVGKPLQVVHSRAELACNQMDWRSFTEDEQQRRFNAFIIEDRDAGYDLSSPPLMRLAVIRSDDLTHRFVWSFHHLLVDGWSLSYIFKEVFLFYESLCEGRQVNLEPARPYRDYIEFLQQQGLDGAEAFWRGALAGYDSPALLTDPEASGDEGEDAGECDALHLKISASTTAKLQAFAREQKLTLNTIVQAAWALALSRYSGQRDVVYGTVVSGRPSALPGAEAMVGLFINTLPVRARVGREPLLGWLRSLQDFMAQLYQYEYSPLVDVQGWSELPRGQQLFETLFVFENFPFDESLRRADKLVQVEDVRFFNRNNYPLTLVVVPGSELSLQMRYYRRRFTAKFIARMLGNVEALLEDMLRNPTRPISQLSLLGEAERRQLLVESSGRRVDFRHLGHVHQLFEAQAEKSPDAVAITFEDEQLTYRELNAGANQLAHHLISAGVGAETRVAIFMERSTEIVVALLAVLKAGGAYVPLDIRSPKDRVAMMLDEIKPRAVLTQRHLLEYFSDYDGPVACPDEVLSSSDRSLENPRARVAGEAAAYVLFTSGSTGTPKGVVIEHRQILNYLNAVVETLNLRDVSSFAMVSPFSSDLANTIIFPSLCSGGRLHIISEQMASDPETLADYFSRHAAGALKIVPSHLNALLSSLQASRILPRQRLILGGEASDWELIEKIKTLAPDLVVHNHYGPTETTVGVLTCRVEQRTTGRTVPLGRPLSNVQAYILDADLNPVPKQVAGELYFGGACVGRGYLNRPELTAERFIPDPFSDERGARIYRTGDLARYQPDGNMEFLGRADNQVKVRGFRVELGEIEAALREHPAVRNAIVLSKRHQSGESRLLAYVVADDGQERMAVELKALLKQKLPDYMLPYGIVTLDMLPLTASGKVDRHRLLAMEVAPEQAQISATAATLVQDMLTGIWAEILGTEGIDPDSNFFDLGGHSLTATQVISRLREAFQIELPLRAIFEAPTVAELSRRIEARIKPAHSPIAPRIKPVPRAGGMPLSFAQQRLWFMDQLHPGIAVYNIPAAVSLEGPLNVAALADSFGQLIDRHEILRTRFQSVNGLPLQFIEPSLEFSIPVIDLTNMPQDERDGEAERLSAEEVQQPFDLSRLPLIRVKLLRMDGQDHLLLLTMHHIISDGWSRGILVREIAALYDACVTGRVANLPELKIQYADFSHWQREWLTGEVLDQQMSYWRQQLGSGVPELKLGADRPRPQVQTYRGEIERFDISEELTNRLRRLSREEGATIFMTLLGGFKGLLRRYSGQDEIVVGADIANRSREETEGLIGFFVNMLVMKTEIAAGMSFRDVVRRVKEVAVGAYCHQDIPFEKIVEEFQPEREMDRAPMFQVVFALQNVPMPKLQLSGLTLTAVEAKLGGVPFDLVMLMGETERGLRGSLAYNADLFEASTIRRILEDYKKFLEAVAADPEQPMADILLLSEEETGGVSVFDFPDAELNQGDFELLLREINRG